MILLSKWGGEVHVGRRLLKLVLRLDCWALLPGYCVLLLLLLLQLRSLLKLLLRLKLWLGLLMVLLAAALLLPTITTICVTTAGLLGLCLA